MIASESHTVADASRCQAALQAAMESVEPVAPDRWRGRPKDSSAPPLLVQLRDGFLLLAGTFSPGTPPSRWDLLKVNASLTGLVKFSSNLDGDLSLRAEIPVEAESNVSLRLDQACRAFAAAQHLTLDPNENPVTVTPEVAPPDLAKLVEAAGWQCSSRRADRCAVLLDTRRGAHTASLTAQAGTVRVSTELASWDSLPTPGREGLSALLLTANARLRLARAIVAEDESGGAAQLEVLFEAPVSAAELRSALEALSVGADLCAPVVDILQHEEAAKLFLAIRGGPRDSEDSQQTTERKL